MKQDEQMSDLALRLLGCAYDELDAAEQRVIRAIAERAPTSRDAAGDDEVTTRPGLGPRLADKVAAVGGSWGFIIGFSLVLFAWMLINSKALEHLGLTFDPYPFIFLNLMLSMLAAIQAPVIMMSQNRQAAKDRLTEKLDYEINLRAELEIMRLHEKIDQMRISELAEKVDALCARMEARG
ncbi:DUF1003 domain-containing protein [Sphingopyxis panaciterrulae]|uniref:Putative membrane protein n=1 Tax=Sphingopyxis panaciterrulae TaxID=462372 RepID=A0A7W9ERT5_9SPHN|nr:DUF1003 domain-containing protein [Sphingopyxis panaciterrulae]MBB5706201.1 putative membrane protein [Sphingopyxis panaciterrulae]